MQNAVMRFKTESFFFEKFHIYNHCLCSFKWTELRFEFWISFVTFNVCHAIYDDEWIRVNRTHIFVITNWAWNNAESISIGNLYFLSLILHKTAQICFRHQIILWNISSGQWEFRRMLMKLLQKFYDLTEKLSWDFRHFLLWFCIQNTQSDIRGWKLKQKSERKTFSLWIIIIYARKVKVKHKSAPNHVSLKSKTKQKSFFNK